MRCKLLFLILSVCATAAATSQHEVFNNAVPFYSASLAAPKGLDTEKATLDNPAAAKLLIEAMKIVQEQSAN